MVETNAAAVAGADLVIVCIPVGQCGAVAREIAGHLAPGAIVSDVGSVKAQIVRDMAPHLPPGVHFVPAHPVAGTEHSGPDAGFAELFIDRWCILTPPPGADAAAVERLSTFWRALGAKVDTMSAEHHDLVLAITSHVPHLIAYTIVGTADDLSRGDALGGAAVLGRRVPRFHPHRGIGSDHVARRLPRQQGRRDGNARAASARTSRG